MLDLSPTNWYGWRGQVTVVDHQSIQAFYLSLIQILNDQPTRPKSIRIGVTQLVHHEVGADKGEGQREKGIQQTGATEVDPDVGIADVDALCHGVMRQTQAATACSTSTVASCAWFWRASVSWVLS